SRQSRSTIRIQINPQSPVRILQSDGDHPRAGDDLPLLLGAAIPDHHSFLVQRDGRTDVPRDAVQGRAHWVVIGVVGLDDEMFFAVTDGSRVRKPQQFDSRMWPL